LPQLRFDRGAPDRRCRPKVHAQLVWLLFAVPTSTDFLGVQTAAHDRDGAGRHQGDCPVVNIRPSEFFGRLPVETLAITAKIKDVIDGQAY
jgi:hypothetical protein